MNRYSSFLLWIVVAFMVKVENFVEAEINIHSLENKILARLDATKYDISRFEGASKSVAEIYRMDTVPPYLEELLSRFQENPALENQLFAAVSQPCSSHMRAWLSALTNLTADGNTWALQMIDAWPKFVPHGILEGNFAAYGAFDECLAIRAELENDVTFKGKYCTSLLQPGTPETNRSNMEFQTRMASTVLLGAIPVLGSCYPSSCSTDEISSMLTNVVNVIPLPGVQVVPYVSYCTTDDKPKLSSGDIGMISVLALIGLLCIIGTALDLLLDKMSSARSGYAIQALLSFSVYTNTLKWLSTKTGGGGENFGCMHGIRFGSTCWVVLAHTWIQISFLNTSNSLEMLKPAEFNWTLFSIVNGTVSVDTFFTMSAILVSYGMLKVLNKTKGKLNVPMMYVHRFLRLTPTYALLVGIVATLFVYFRDGPMWFVVTQSSDFCKKTWWHNLLYINNLINYTATADPTDGMCHDESWYLANDMQFFLVAPLFVYPLFKWEKLGLALLSLVTAASIATPWIVTNQKNLIPTFLLLSSDLGAYKEHAYTKPWMRFGPYAAGLWTGYFLYKTSNKRLQLPKWVVLFGWLGSTTGAALIIYGIIPWFDPANQIPKGTGGFYGGAHRFGWGVVISWIIFACARGYGGPVNAFLSWKVFMPLGRLTFCVYLTSFYLQTAFHNSMRQPIYYDVYTFTNLFLAHTVLSFLVGFLCCITMESPIIALEKLIFQGPPKSDHQNLPTPEK